MSTTVSIHAIHTVPSSCINRDRSGMPKMAPFGGAMRAEVSSQAWKRAMREMMNEKLVNRGWRENEDRPVGRLAREIEQLDHSMSPEDARDIARGAFAGAGIDLVTKFIKHKDETVTRVRGYREALLFFSVNQYKALAEVAVRFGQELLEGVQQFDAKAERVKGDKSIPEKGRVRGTDTGKDAVIVVPEGFRAEAREALRTGHSVDVALFGRMLADGGAGELEVTGAATVARAMSVDVAQASIDFFTAMDDGKQVVDQSADGGASMMGDKMYTSGTLYRHASVSTKILADNLGDRGQVADAVALFLEAFALSMPSGSRNAFGNNTLPETIVVELRDDQAVSAARAFVKPLDQRNLHEASQRLIGQLDKTARVYGGPDHRFVMDEDSPDSLTLGGLIDAVKGAL